MSFPGLRLPLFSLETRRWPEAEGPGRCPERAARERGVDGLQPALRGSRLVAPARQLLGLVNTWPGSAPEAGLWGFEEVPGLPTVDGEPACSYHFSYCCLNYSLIRI